MIYLYSGTPRSGKSLNASYSVINYLNNKKGVITNFPLHLESYYSKRKISKIGHHQYVTNFEITSSYLKQYAQDHHVPNKEHQTLIVIDECSILFNSRQWDAKNRMEWIIFFQQHAKLGFDVILISHNDRMIDRQIRSFVEYEFKHRSIGNYKRTGKILSFLGGGVFICVKYWYGVREKIGTDFLRLDKRKAKIYDTFSLFE